MQDQHSRKIAKPHTHPDLHSPPSPESATSIHRSHSPPDPYITIGQQDTTGDSPSLDVLAGDLEFLEMFIHSRLRSYMFSGTLAFHSRPTVDVKFERTELMQTTTCNVGPHALDSGHWCNDQYLKQEEWLLLMFSSVSTIRHVGVPALDPKCDILLTSLRQEWVRMEIHKQHEWVRQKQAKALSERIGAAFVDAGWCFLIDPNQESVVLIPDSYEGRYFARPEQFDDPITVVHHVTALLLHLIYRVPRRATRLLLIALRVLVKVTMHRALDAEQRTFVDSLPIDIRTILGRLNLDPVTRPYICCPACFALYAKPYLQVCMHKEAQNSKPCGARMWRKRTICGREMSFPLRVYLYQDIKEWLGRLLSRKGMEDIMDAMLKRAHGVVPEVMSVDCSVPQSNHNGLC
ncbi:hypothetical protein C8Q74DRAFT_1374243 [Fomes fomentarius]|nr:hypothetical protein C8Q74DRAFT_1374243 [Fomes fomentarius]